MATTTEPLKTEGEISGEERIGSCSKRSLEAVARDLYVPILAIPDAIRPKEVHVYCRYEPEGRFVADLMTKACGEKAKVVLLLTDPPRRRDEVGAYFIDLSFFVEWAQKPSSRYNKG
jgi:hypothetical protein